VVLGSGWGGFNIALTVNKEVPLTVISPANHFLFTPLLPSSAVGTLEFRCIEEPIR
jgi:NADH dehydrogenase FAD-containing subunit